MNTAQAIANACDNSGTSFYFDFGHGRTHIETIIARCWPVSTNESDESTTYTFEDGSSITVTGSGWYTNEDIEALLSA